MKAPSSLSLGFFICGVFNNFAYVVMLSASKSLLPPTSFVSLVLVFDDLPALAAQILSPLLLQYISYPNRVIAIIVATIMSLVLAAYASDGDEPEIALLAVTIASLCFGFGESTFFSLLSFHSTQAIGAFSSGTGCAGVLGSGMYLALIEILSSSSLALLACAALLPIHGASFALLVLPEHMERISSKIDGGCDGTTNRELLPITASSNKRKQKKQEVIKDVSSFWQSFNVLREHGYDVARFFLPLWAMYIVTYTINHALLPHTFDVVNSSEKMKVKTSEESYVSLFLTYQMAVFASRSSLNLFRLRFVSQVWILVLLQSCVFAVLFLFTFGYFQSMMIISNLVRFFLYPLVLFEGLISGAAYVNTFALLRMSLDAKSRELVMGIVVTATTAGPIAAALLGMLIESSLSKQSANSHLLLTVDDV
jgi:battenin